MKQGNNTTTLFTDIPIFGDIYTLEQFRREVRFGNFIDYDGCGYFATNTKESNIEFDFSKPSWRPIWATHIIWYNK